MTATIRWPGLAELLDGKCDHCGETYHHAPCANSDHFQTTLDLAIAADNKPWVSYGCQHPTEMQAPVLESHRHRRHPYRGRRPEWSGYCVVESCACTCHIDETPELTIEIEEI